MVEVPVIILGYNPNYYPIGLTTYKIRDKVAEKLNGLSIYMVCRKKGEFFIIVSRKSEPIVEPLMTHDFCYLSRGDFIESTIELTIENFYSSLQYKIEKYQDDLETCIKYHLPILRKE